MEFVKKNALGILICLVIAVPAWLLGQRFEVVGGPVFAILIGMVIALWWKQPARGTVQDGIAFTAKKVLQYATMCSNAGFMGNPIIEGLYGAQGLLYGSVYLIPLRFFMWSAGLACFTKSTPGETVKKLATHPCILAVLLGFALLLTQWQMPAFLDRTLSYFSACTLPVSILIVGSILAGVRVRSIFTGMTAYYCAVRLLLVPLLTLAACRLLGLDALVTGVCVVLSGMPAGSTTAILAEKYGGDAEYASKCIFLSTLLSLATIPLLCGLMAAL